MKPIFHELLLAWRLARSPAMESVLARAGLGELPASPHWGIDWVEPDGPLYRPAAQGGLVAAILPARLDGPLIDLVATSLETRAMRRRQGLAMVLGDEQIALAQDNGTPL